MKKQKYKLISNQGFTLIEILVAIFILAFMMLGIFTLVSNVTATKDRIIIEDKEFLQLETALARMEIDFSQIFTPLFYSQNYQIKNNNAANANEEDSTPGGAENQIYQNHPKFSGINHLGQPIPKYLAENVYFEFFTASNRKRIQNSKESNYAWVRYTMEEDQDQETKGAELIRYYDSENPFQTDEAEILQKKRFILLKNISNLKFSFWDEKKEDFVDGFDEVKDKKNYNLKAIKVQFDWTDQNEYEHKIERVFRSVWPAFEAENYAKLEEDAWKKANAPAKQETEQSEINPEIPTGGPDEQ